MSKKSLSNTERFNLAAYAAGLDFPKENSPWYYVNNSGVYKDISLGGDGTRMECWNPLENNAQAFELMVILNIPFDGAGMTLQDARAYIFNYAVDRGLRKLASELKVLE